MKKIKFEKQLFIAIFIFVLDQLSKILIEKYIYDDQIVVLKNIFSLTYVKNTGGAWGVMNGIPIIFLILVPIVIVAVFMAAINSHKLLEKVSWYIIIGGALGNYIDRLTRGYVVDFLDFHIWPVFNVADIFVVIGCFLLIVSSFTKKSDV